MRRIARRASSREAVFGRQVTCNRAGESVNTFDRHSDIALRFNPLNRLTNMMDGIGATVFDYFPGGQLASEDGPWSSDSVTNRYPKRLSNGLGSGGVVPELNLIVFERITNPHNSQNLEK